MSFFPKQYNEEGACAQYTVHTVKELGHLSLAYISCILNVTHWSLNENVMTCRIAFWHYCLGSSHFLHYFPVPGQLRNPYTIQVSAHMFPKWGGSPNTCLLKGSSKSWGWWALSVFVEGSLGKGLMAKPVGPGLSWEPSLLPPGESCFALSAEIIIYLCTGMTKRKKNQCSSFIYTVDSLLVTGYASQVPQWVPETIDSTKPCT